MSRTFLYSPMLWALFFALGLSGLALSAQTILITERPYDIFVPLDAGIRFLSGIYPNLDYPSPIGPIFAAVNGITMLIGGIDVRAILWANLLSLVVCFALLAIVLRGTPGIVKLLALVSVISIFFILVDVDSIPPAYSYVANYNNWGWGFFAVIVVWTLRLGESRLIDNIAAGIALSCLFYLKLSIFVGAAALMPLGLCLDRRFKDYAAVTAVLAAAWTVGLGLGFFHPYILDNLAAARATGSMRLFKVEWQVLAFVNIPATIVMAIICYRLGVRNKAVAVICVAWIILHLTGLQNNYKLVPLIGLPMILVSPRLPTAYRGLLAAPAILQTVVLAVAATAAYPLQGWIEQEVGAQPIGPAGTIGERMMLSTNRGMGDWSPNSPGDSLPNTDGIVHLQLFSAQDLLGNRSGRVMTLDFANTILASWPHFQPAIGAPLWYDWQRSFSASVYPSPDHVFKHISFVLVPRRFREDQTRHLVDIYRPWIEKCSMLINENTLWALYEPRSDAPSDCHDARDVGAPAESIVN